MQSVTLGHLAATRAIRCGPGRLVPKKGYIGPVSTKTHSGDPDGTGGSGGPGGVSGGPGGGSGGPGRSVPKKGLYRDGQYQNPLGG